MAGSGVKRPPQGRGGRAYRDVFTATLRNARHSRLNSTNLQTNGALSILNRFLFRTP